MYIFKNTVTLKLIGFKTLNEAAKYFKINASSLSTLLQRSNKNIIKVNNVEYEYKVSK